MNAARYSQVLLAPWRQRDRAAPWSRRIIAAVMLVATVGCLIWLPPQMGWRVAVGMLLVVAMGVWMAVGYNLLEQNHPTAARTVPGHARTLRYAALLGWTLFTMLNTALVLLMLPAIELWPLLLLCSGFFAAFLLWTTRLVWIWLLMMLVSPLSLALGKQLAPARQAIAALWETHTFAVLLLCLVFQAWLVVRAIADGGARHEARYARQALMRRAMQMQMEGKPPVFLSWAPFERVFRPYMRILSAWLQHVLNRADNSSTHSVMQRAEIVLHGQQHWLKYALTMGTIGAIVVTAFTGVISTTGVSLAVVLRQGAFGMGIGIASAGLNAGFTTANMLWQSRREQALLRLLPGMPQGAALNRAVARLQWRDFSVSWLLTTAALAALGAGADDQTLLCLPFAALPIATLTLTRRPALMRMPTPLAMMVPSFAFLSLAGALFLLQQQLGVSLWLEGVAMLAVSVPLLIWRW
ncbi:MAG: hypothetical protein EOP39_14605, partial [Rubrivivax sp.]